MDEQLGPWNVEEGHGRRSCDRRATDPEREPPMLNHRNLWRFDEIEWAERRYPSWQFTNQPPIVAVALSAPLRFVRALLCHPVSFLHLRPLLLYLVAGHLRSLLQASDSTRLVQQLYADVYRFYAGPLHPPYPALWIFIERLKTIHRVIHAAYPGYWIDLHVEMNLRYSNFFFLFHLIRYCISPNVFI